MKKVGLLIFSILVSVLFVLMTLAPVSSDNGNRPNVSSLPNSKNTIPSTEYPEWRGDAAKTGNSSAAGPADYNELWMKSHGAVTPTYASPVVQYDLVYFTYAVEGGTQGTKCYNMQGNQVWTFPRGNPIGSPLIYNGRVYISTIAGSLYCIDAYNATTLGNEYWVYDPPGTMAETAGYYPGCGSPVTDGKLVFYSTMDPTGLHAVNIATGTKAWSRPLGGSTSTEASPTYANGRVFCGGGSPWNTGSNNLYCFNATTGATIWTWNTGGKACTTPAIVNNRLYYGSMDGKLYCMKADDTPVSNTSAPQKYWEYNIGTTIYASPAVGYGRIYIGDTSSTTNFHCFEDMGSSASKKWTVTIPIGNSGGYGVSSSATITPNYIYTATSGSDIVCLNRNDGSSKWSKTYGAGWYGMTSPAVYKEKVFVSIDDGKLYALGPAVDLSPPAVISSIPASDATAVAIDTQVSVKFNEALDTATLSGSSVFLKDSGGSNVAGQVTHDMGIQTVYFTPNTDLENEETYTLTITTAVTDTSANPLALEFTTSFTTTPLFPPTIGAIPTLHPTEDILYTINLTSIIDDPDNAKEELILTENSSYAELKGFVLELLYPNGVTGDVVNLSVSDNVFTVYKDINVVVDPANDIPVVTEIPAQTAYEDVPLEIDMEDHITDIDTQMSEITIMADSGYSSVVDRVITLTYPEGILEDHLNITINDRGLKTYTEFDVTVIPVNDAPTIGLMKTAEATEDVTLEYYVGQYLSDVDNEKNELTIEVDSPYVEVIGQFLNLTYPDGITEDLLDVKVFDGELYGNTSLEVIVSPVNDPPAWTGSIDISATEDVPGEFDLTDIISDEENVNALRISTDSNYGNMDKNTFKFLYPDGVLAESVTFELTDGISTVDLIGNVTVTPVNDAPELAEPKVTPESGNLTTEFTFKVTLMDIDIGESRNAMVKLHIGSDAFECVKVKGTHKSGATYQYKTTLAEGNHSFHFTADDLDGGTAETGKNSVSAEKDEKTGGGGGSGGGSSSSSLGLLIGAGIGIFVFIILLVIVLIIVILVVKGKKKAAPDEAPKAEAEPTDNEMMPHEVEQQYQQQDLYGAPTTAQYQQYDTAYDQPQTDGEQPAQTDYYNQTDAAQQQLGQVEQAQQQIDGQPAQPQLPPATDQGAGGDEYQSF